jgi:hypothetical protein
MNGRLLKPLKDALPALKPQWGSDRFADNLPSTSLRPAVLHLKLANQQVGKNLENLRGTLKDHNDEVNSTERLKESKLLEAFTKCNLIPPSRTFDFILSSLNHIWRTIYVCKLNESHTLLYNVHQELLNELESCKQPNQGSKLILRYRNSSDVIWEEKQQGDNAKVWEAIKAVLVDDVILGKLKQADESTHNLKSDIDEIVRYLSKLSDDIADGQYEDRADCCYVNVPWLVRLFV